MLIIEDAYTSYNDSGNAKVDKRKTTRYIIGNNELEVTGFWGAEPLKALVKSYLKEQISMRKDDNTTVVNSTKEEKQ